MKSNYGKYAFNCQLRTAHFSYLIATFFLAGILGCSPFARLEGVIVDDRLAQDDELSNVRVMRNNELLISTINMPINKGDFVQTNSETQAVIVSSDWEVIVFPNSDIEIHSIFVKIGKVLVKTFKKIKDEFTVESEYVTAGPEGTEFLVEVDGSVTEVTVVEGRVLLEFPTTLNQPVYVTDRTKATVKNEGETVSSFTSDVSTARLNEIRQWVVNAERVINPEVPQLVNLQIGEARARLRSVGLEIREREKITGRVDAGVVTGQSPRAGAVVDIGETIKVDVEAKSVVVPNLIGLPIDEARNSIAKAGLKVISARSELRTEGEAETVFYQSISAGKFVKPGKGLTLKLVEPAVAVPNLVGMDQKTALATLKNVGLVKGKITEIVTTQFSEGTVATQSPSAGAIWKKGNSVDLGLAKAEPMCDLPVVRRMTEKEATSTLKEAGFNVKIVVGGEGNGIGDQSPAPGTVTCGITVTLTVLRIQ
jgi:beta-lactam-binding protein with PASTA domain